MKKVSVVIPIYKGNCYISKLIGILEKNWESANRIEPVDVELVLVNDYPEEELVIEDDWKRNISLLKVTNKSNRGIHYSRVQGVLHSDGDYITFLDQDDVISPVYLREQLKEIENYDMVICNGKNNGNLIYRNSMEIKKAIDLNEYMEGFNRIVSPGQVLLKRSILPREWLENILIENGADDYFLWLLIFLQKRKVTVQDKALYWHVVSGENSSNDYRMMRSSVLEMIERLSNLGYLSDTDRLKIAEKNLAFIEEESVSLSKYLKERRYKCLLETWMGLRDRGISVNAFLCEIRIKKIVIYGIGMIGKHLYYELQDRDVCVEGFLDQNQKLEPLNLPRITPGEELKDIDAIIVTPFMEYLQIKDYLKQWYSCQIISIETVIFNSDYKLMEE